MTMQGTPSVTVIPTEALSEEALAGVIEAFVLREGTDYGHRDYSLGRKCVKVLYWLRRFRNLGLSDQAASSSSTRYSLGVRQSSARWGRS